jgi:hypothetical protein
MTKMIYLHIGTHKTGSTIIQNYLRKYQQNLITNDSIYYLPLDPIFKTIPGLDEESSAIVTACRKKFLTQIKVYEKKQPTSYIMSYEGFSGSVRHGYINSGVVASMLAKIFQGYDIRIIVYLRQQDQFIESMYTQLIHQGESLSFPEYLETLSQQSFNWLTLLKSYAKVFGKESLYVKPYSREYLPEHDSIIRQFLRTIGAEWVEGSSTRSLQGNVGYSRGALELARRCNVFLEPEGKVRLRNLLQETNARLPSEKSSFFSGTERKTYLELYATSNTIVVEQYMDLAGKDHFNSAGNVNGQDIIPHHEESASVAIILALIGKNGLLSNKEPHFIKFIREIEERSLKWLRRIRKLWLR